nr:MAG TPA: hypothetical protein [Caudoviricetes sp.]
MPTPCPHLCALVPLSARVTRQFPIWKSPCSPAKLAGHSRGLPISVGITGV